METRGSLPDSSVKLYDKNMGKVLTDSTFSAPEQPPSLEQQGAYYVPTTNSFEYPGEYGSSGQAVDKGNFSSAAGGSCTLDSTSLAYEHAGYDPLSEYTQRQQPSTYGSDGFSSYLYDSTLFGNGSAPYSGPLQSETMGPTGKSNGHNGPKANTNLSSKTPSLPRDDRVRQAPTFNTPVHQNTPLNPSNKQSGFGFQSTNRMRGYQGAPKFSSFANRNPSGSMQYGPQNYQSNRRTWNDNYGNKHKTSEISGQNAEHEAQTELTRGPRLERKISSSERVEEAEQPWWAFKRDAYNLQDFKIVYNDAKFFVVKSYSEDDVHKSIKYNVWSSTPNGNRKLEAAFQEADAKANETGQKCPIFLFFSVNMSGQFVGVAEMVGRVDFTKNMDFWQVDKWDGFFPVRWHIIKDVPSSQLRHITLANNENKAVTHSRDTQEILLAQGLAMLRIFKNYPESSSVLDDLSFYEKREKTLKAKRKNKPIPQDNGFEGRRDSSSALVSHAKNLSLGS